MRRVAADRSLCVDATEVTVAGFRACVAAAACKPLAGETHFAGLRPDATDAVRETCVAAGSDPSLPVNCVERAAAAAFCAWRGGRLPTDAEWLMVALGRDADERRAPWGALPLDASRANVCDDACVAWAEDVGLLRAPAIGGDDGASTLAPVGSYPTGASPDRVLDLFGNVGEWTATDRAGSALVRGGSFMTTAERALREPRLADPRAASVEIGFRCVATASADR